MNMRVAWAAARGTHDGPPFIKIIKSSDVRHYCATPVVARVPRPAQQVPYAYTHTHTRASHYAAVISVSLTYAPAGVLWHVHNVNRYARAYAYVHRQSCVPHPFPSPILSVSLRSPPFLFLRPRQTHIYFYFHNGCMRALVLKVIALNGTTRYASRGMHTLRNISSVAAGEARWSGV